MSSDDKFEIYAKAGLSLRLGFGENPALIVVDMQIGFTDPARSTLAAHLDKEIAHINRLIALTREKHVPVFFTVIGYDASVPNDGGLWVKKAPTLLDLQVGSDLVQIDPRLKKQPEDQIIIKKYASAFFGTDFASVLKAGRFDTLIVTGCTTSGCIRATVVDAISHGFRPIIPIECVGDRAKEPHDSNLFDMQGKYGDVLPTEEVLAYLATLS